MFHISPKIHLKEVKYKFRKKEYIYKHKSFLECDKTNFTCYSKYRETLRKEIRNQSTKCDKACSRYYATETCRFESISWLYGNKKKKLTLTFPVAITQEQKCALIKQGQALLQSHRQTSVSRIISPVYCILAWPASGAFTSEKN